MIFKTIKGEEVRFSFLTLEMYSLFRGNQEVLKDIESLLTSSEQIHENETATILKLQDALLKKLTGHDYKIKFPDNVTGRLVKKTFNDWDGKSLLNNILADQLFYGVIGSKDFGVTLISSKEELTKFPEVEILESNTLGKALIEAIYKKVGYLDSHFGPSNSTRVDGKEFTLSDVYLFNATK